MFAVCNVPRPRLVRAEFSQSKGVVIAHLVKAEHIEPKNDQDYHLYTFEIDTALRGDVPKRFVLWNENSSARLAFNIVAGRKYLLFLDYWAEKHWWTADGCGNSGEVSGRTRTLREIERVRSLRSALITGEVAIPKRTTAKVIAVRKEDGRRFESAIVDGRFRLDVPPGEYSVQPSAEHHSFALDRFSYEDADHLKLGPGACAQIAFETH